MGGCKSKTKRPRDHDGLALPDHIAQIITNSEFSFFSDLILRDYWGIRNAHNLLILFLLQQYILYHVFDQ